MSEFRFEVLACQPDWLAKCDPRARLLTMFVFVAVTVSLTQLGPLLSMLSLALLLARIVNIDWRVIIHRLLAFEGFMVLVLVFLPFAYPGDPMASLWGMHISASGIERAVVIVLRGNAVVLAVLALIGTLEPIMLGRAMARLGVPKKLIHLFLMTVRYISVLFSEYSRLRTAMTARGFRAQGNMHTWRSFGWLIGMLLVRSMERAQRVHDAMRCRGFNGQFHLLEQSNWQLRDTLFLAISGSLCLLPLIWQVFA
ncbi:cobalt ECF transporter T component CbiQ [Celerinatantimonas sp. YJH-8]|uniref:cobalt ECF transporter T component CbiQ n=1 Tax=Celerinatantimonas sp. YJH-8 TaxID=3228714 RepID=UPI0038BEB978